MGSGPLNDVRKGGVCVGDVDYCVSYGCCSGTRNIKGVSSVTILSSLVSDLAQRVSTRVGLNSHVERINTLFVCFSIYSFSLLFTHEQFTLTTHSRTIHYRYATD